MVETQGGRAAHRVAGSPSGERPAFTLVEILMAFTMLAILGAAAITFFVHQARAVTMTAGRLDAQQNVSFALDGVDHDLRVAGSGLGISQPMVIEAHPYAVTFNADLVTNDTASVTSAAYYDPSIPDSLAQALTPARAIIYPFSGAVTYPDSTYLQSTGVLSNAETISYWATPDSTSATPGVYLLLRRVNNGAATVVARGLVFPGGMPAFRYFIPGTAINSRVELLAPTLPLYFKAGNVGPDTMLAKLSEVRLQLQAVFTDPMGNQVYRSINENIPLLNAGLLHLPACGVAPQAPLSITPVAPPSGDSIVVTWPASSDEIGGKQDVRSYSVFRRPGVAAPWGTPVFTVGALGTPTYTWTDYVVPLGQSYQYGVVSRDCTPSLSAMTAAAATVTPSP